MSWTRDSAGTNPVCGQSGTWTRGHWISSPTNKALMSDAQTGHQATLPPPHASLFQEKAKSRVATPYRSPKVWPTPYASIQAYHTGSVRQILFIHSFTFIHSHSFTHSVSHSICQLFSQSASKTYSWFITDRKVKCCQFSAIVSSLSGQDAPRPTMTGASGYASFEIDHKGQVYYKVLLLVQSLLHLLWSYKGNRELMQWRVLETPMTAATKTWLQNRTLSSVKCFPIYLPFWLRCTRYTKCSTFACLERTLFM